MKTLTLKIWPASRVALLCLAMSPAVRAADTVTVAFSGAGSNMASSIDTNHDGITGYIATNQGVSGFGTFTADNYNESLAPVGVNTTNCPGAYEVPLLSVNTVFTFQDHSQFWEQLVSGYFCIRPDNTFTLSAKTKIVNGTGMFEGATGTIQTNAQGSVVFAAGSGPTAQPILLQQSFSGTMTVTYSPAVFPLRYQ
jgi:hypothetical protein